MEKCINQPGNVECVYAPDERQQQIGRVTVLEALAEESEAVSPNMSRRSTQQGNVDYEDD